MSQSKFFRFFPMPTFLGMPSSGLSISDAAVRFVQFAEGRDELLLHKFGEKRFARHTIENGDILNPGGLALALREFREEHGLRFVHVALPDEKIYIFKIGMPRMQPADIRRALEFKIEENVPITLSEAIFDFVVAGENPENGETDVVVAVISKQVAEGYSAAFKAAGYTALSFDVESQAIANVVVPKQEKGMVFVVHFDAKRTSIYLVKNNIVQFSITIPLDDQAAAGPYMHPGERPGNAYEKIYSPKYKRLPMILEQIERISNYWESKESATAAAERYRVIACGRDAFDTDLIEHLSGLLKKDITVAEVWENVLSGSQVPSIPKQDAFDYSAAIGAALGSIKIDKNHV